MEKMNDLRELLKHDVIKLESAETQVAAAMPAMIARVQNPMLKQALEEHLVVSQRQLERLERVQQMLGADNDDVTDRSGFLSKLMGGGIKCKATEGLIDEGQKIMAEEMSPEVMDAAIIGAAQKIEHLEIASYGTARTYAEQLGLTDVAQLLQQTLLEEHDADDRLTALAVSDVNIRAEVGTGINR
jgi:ferritin-like metal-binding protein YciE